MNGSEIPEVPFQHPISLDSRQHVALLVSYSQRPDGWEEHLGNILSNKWRRKSSKTYKTPLSQETSDRGYLRTAQRGVCFSGLLLVTFPHWSLRFAAINLEVTWKPDIELFGPYGHSFGRWCQKKHCSHAISYHYGHFWPVVENRYGRTRCMAVMTKRLTKMFLFGGGRFSLHKSISIMYIYIIIY